MMYKRPICPHCEKELVECQIMFISTEINCWLCDCPDVPEDEEMAFVNDDLRSEIVRIREWDDAVMIASIQE